MNPDLMRAPCMQVRLDEAISLEPQKHAPICARLTALAPPRGHTSSTMQVSRHGKLDAPGIFLEAPVDQRYVRLLHFSLTELLHQLAVRRIISRNQQRARSLPVQPVHNSGTQLAANRRKLSALSKFV